MRLGLVLLALVFVACAKPAPVAPHAAPANKAVTYAKLVVADSACVPLRTGEAAKPDTAICENTTVVSYCAAGAGVAPVCLPLADYREKEQPKPDAPKPDAVPSSPPPAAAAPSPGEKAVKTGGAK